MLPETHIFFFWPYSRLSNFSAFLYHVYIKIIKLTIFHFLKCKTKTIPILMYQMCISTDQVSSVVLGPKSWKTKKNIVKIVKEPKKNKQILGHEIEPNPSKDRAIYAWGRKWFKVVMPSPWLPGLSVNLRVESESKILWSWTSDLNMKILEGGYQKLICLSFTT
jgi:hypothetical protein